ncbi:MAG: hypothetical protein ACXWH0_17130 [Acidimicrobiia bacterium]
MPYLWSFFRSVACFRWLTLLLVILVAGSAATEAQAAKAKKPPVYRGSASATGQGGQTSSCGGTYYNFQSIWRFDGLIAKTPLYAGGELKLTAARADGAINWSVDESCNGQVQTGNCSVALDEKNYILPFILVKAKGGLKVDFQLSLIGVGCGSAQVNPYGGGFETFDQAPCREAQGFITAKKIGKKVISVPISGYCSGTAGNGSRTFSNTMSGTLTLKRLK